MKKITIYQENSEAIIFEYNNNDDLSDFYKRFEKLFISSNVLRIEIDNKIILIRPSKITSIKIEELSTESTIIEKPNENIIEEKIQYTTENVITDVEK